MEADVVLAAVQAVEAVEAAGDVVPLENADALAEMRQPDSRRQAGQARPDDRDVVVGTRVQNLGVR
jgi:hypothetical protein